MRDPPTSPKVFRPKPFLGPGAALVAPSVEGSRCVNKCCLQKSVMTITSLNFKVDLLEGKLPLISQTVFLDQSGAIGAKCPSLRIIWL